MSKCTSQLFLPSQNGGSLCHNLTLERRAHPTKENGRHSEASENVPSSFASFVLFDSFELQRSRVQGSVTIFSRRSVYRATQYRCTAQSGTESSDRASPARLSGFVPRTKDAACRVDRSWVGTLHVKMKHDSHEEKKKGTGFLSYAQASPSKISSKTDVWTIKSLKYSASEARGFLFCGLNLARPILIRTCQVSR